MSDWKHQVALVAANNVGATDLNLWGARIGDEGASLVAEALKVNRTLRSLNLSSNQIGDMGAARLAEALKINMALQILQISDNQIGVVGVARLCEALLVTSTLKELYFATNQLGVDAAVLLAEALKSNRSLRLLNLDGNFIEDEGAARFAEALKINASLKALYLAGNRIWEQGAVHLADALEMNASLTQLYVSTSNKELTRTFDELVNRNKRLVSMVRFAALFLIGIRNGATHAGMGAFGRLPKEVVKMIAMRVWATCGQPEWIRAWKQIADVVVDENASFSTGGDTKNATFCRLQ